MMTTLTCDVASSSVPSDPWRPSLPMPSFALSVREYAAASDVELIACARVKDDCHALAELMGRYYLWLLALIGRLARRAGLRREDAEDAQHDAIHALLGAVRDYDLEHWASPEGSSFRRYLRRRVISRFQDALRRLRWLEARRRGEKELVAALEKQSCQPGARSAGPAWLAPAPIDPTEAAQRRELAMQVRQVFASLSPEQQELWEAMAAGTPRKELSRQQGVSRRTVHRRQEALCLLLRTCFKDRLC